MENDEISKHCCGRNCLVKEKAFNRCAGTSSPAASSALCRCLPMQRFSRRRAALPRKRTNQHIGHGNLVKFKKQFFVVQPSKQAPCGFLSVRRFALPARQKASRPTKISAVNPRFRVKKQYIILEAAARKNARFLSANGVKGM